MATETNDTELLPLAEIAKRLPSIRAGKQINRSTVYRWATVGLRSRAGYRIRLQARFVGGTLCACMKDVQDFFDSKDDIAWEPEKLQASYRERQ